MLLYRHESCDGRGAAGSWRQGGGRLQKVREMTAEGEDAAARVHVIEEFLSHLAEERIISAAQLLLAKEALQLWGKPMTGGGGMGDAQQQQQQQQKDEEEQQPLPRPTDPQASKAPGLICHAADNEEQQQAQKAQPSQPLSGTAPKRLLCMPSPSHIPEEGGVASSAATPRVPCPNTEADAGEPLARLPTQVLEDVLLLLAAEPGGSSIRCTCHWLRSAFDRCNTHLVLTKAKELPDNMRGRLLDLVRSSPSVSSLTLGDSQLPRLTWPEVLEAGGQQLLQRLERLSMRQEGVSDLGPLAACSRLQQLDLEGCSGVQDLGPLAGCAGLRELNISGCSSIEGLGPLAACVALQDLDMVGCEKVSDIGALAACAGLLRLVIGDDAHTYRSESQVQDISALAGCVGLQHLSLAGCTQLQDLNPLTACVALMHLNLSWCSQVHDLSPLASCTALQHLNLLCCSQVHDFSPLVSCSALQHLDIACCSQVQDFLSLGTCAALQHLNLTGCDEVHDLSSLSSCTVLQHLDLSGCREVQCLSPLASCTALQHLVLSNNHQLHDLSPLASCIALQHLDLSECSQVLDLSPLASCTALQHLDLRGLRGPMQGMRPAPLGLNIMLRW